jgi:hypothetical protein
MKSSNDSDLTSPSSNQSSSFLAMAMSEEGGGGESSSILSSIYKINKMPGKIRSYQANGSEHSKERGGGGVGVGVIDINRCAQLVSSSVEKIKRQYEKTTMDQKLGLLIPKVPKLKPPRIITPRPYVKNPEILPKPPTMTTNNSSGSASLMGPHRVKQSRKNPIYNTPANPMSNSEQLQAQLLHQQSVLNTMNEVHFQPAHQQQAQKQTQQQQQQQNRQFYHFIPIPNQMIDNSSKTGPLMVSHAAQSASVMSGTPSPATSQLSGIDMTKFPIFTATTTADGKLLLLPANPNVLMTPSSTAAAQQQKPAGSQFVTSSIEHNLNQQQMLLNLINQKHQQMNSLATTSGSRNNQTDNNNNIQSSASLTNSNNGLLQQINGSNSGHSLIMTPPTPEQQANSINTLLDQTEVLKHKLRMEEEKNSILLNQMNAADKKKSPLKTKEGSLFVFIYFMFQLLSSFWDFNRSKSNNKSYIVF